MSETSVEKSSRPAPDSCFLPNFCSVRVVFAVVITAELLALVLALSDSEVGRDFTSKLSLYSLFIQWVALSWAALICVLRARLDTLLCLFRSHVDSDVHLDPRVGWQEQAIRFG